MIVCSIQSKNVLKYKVLHLKNLPERGIIGISGYNESGKSTIGEIICFALFGRTYSLTEDELDKAIYWGESSCEAILEFKVEDHSYTLTRFLDKDGNHSAKLIEQGHDDEPIARGVKPVSDILFDILGYEFEEFIESFYLAQREITAPHPHSLAVKIMAGVAPLEYVIAELDEEINQKNEILADIQSEIDAIEEEKTGMDFVASYLPELEDSINDIEVQMVSNKNNVQSLEAATTLYVQHDKSIIDNESSHGTSSFFRFVMFMIALFSGLSWGLFTQKPELNESITLLNLFNQYIPYWQDSYIRYLGFLALVAAFFMIIFATKMSIISGKIKKLKLEAARLGEVMTDVRKIEDFIEIEEEEEDEGFGSENDFESDSEDEIVPVVRATDEEYKKLLSKVAENVASVKAVEEYSSKELAWLNDLISRQQELFVALESEVDVEVARLHQIAYLHESIESLEEKGQALKARRAVREQAIQLLDSASEMMSQRFNHNVRDLVADTLPLFTQQRYEHLRIDDGLKVRVFSGEKRDFMNLEEVSSGTQRQIMLALRLALSQQLMGRMVKGKQFTFLDEPFAFFDEERTKQALDALNQMDGALSQVWIIGQSFSQDAANDFALELKCSRDISELVAG